MRCIFRIFLAIFVPFHHEKLKFRRIKIKELFFNKSPTYGFAIFGAIKNIPFHHRKMNFRKKKVKFLEQLIPVRFLVTTFAILSPSPNSSWQRNKKCAFCWKMCRKYDHFFCSAHPGFLECCQVIMIGPRKQPACSSRERPESLFFCSLLCLAQNYNELQLTKENAVINWKTVVTQKKNQNGNLIHFFYSPRHI